MDNTNPGDLFGGTWIEYGKGRTLVGVEDNSISGQEGGSKTVTLTTANLPSHSHTTPSTSLSDGKTGNEVSSSSGYYYKAGTAGMLANTNDIISYHDGKSSGTYDSGSNNVRGMGLNHYHTVTGTIPSMTTSEVGDDVAFSVQNPYITVYMWKRTA